MDSPWKEGPARLLGVAWEFMSDVAPPTQAGSSWKGSQKIFQAAKNAAALAVEAGHLSNGQPEPEYSREENKEDERTLTFHLRSTSFL